jgi:hypothetical protein
MRNSNPALSINVITSCKTGTLQFAYPPTSGFRGRSDRFLETETALQLTKEVKENRNT